MLWCGKLLNCIFLLPHVVRCFSHGSYRPGQYSTAQSVRPSIVSCSPFIAVLRNVDRKSALEVVHALYEAGFAMVSVTADTPGFEDILRALSSEATFEGLFVGASSVTSPEQVSTASSCGAKFISSTVCDVAVVRRTKELGLISIPGVSTAAQASAAVEAGGDILKVFPATKVSPATFGAIVASLSPAAVPVIAAGGIEVEDLEAYSNSGASGFAVGKTVFKSEMSPAGVNVKARRFIAEKNRLRWAHGSNNKQRPL